MSEPITHLPIFVYGTLRTGQSNWARMLRNPHRTPAAFNCSSSQAASSGDSAGGGGALV